jgi:predicted nucleic acid-binding protein
MDLFIDSNVLLSFYHFTGDDLEELKKLIVLLEKKKLRLYLPSQVVSEFRRNRESKIADTLKRLKEQRLNLQFPQICKDYAEYAALRELQKSYEAQHAALLNKLSEDIENRSSRLTESPRSFSS